MVHDADTQQLAAYLRMLKDRTGRSFDALGRRAGVSASSLHRYCAGSTVPTGFSSLLAFAKVCGASRDELRELQRLWVLADARRDASRNPPEADNQQPTHAGPAQADHQTKAADQTATPVPADLDEPIETGRAAVDVTLTGEVDVPVRRRLSKSALVATGAMLVLLGIVVWAVSPSDDPYRPGPPVISDDNRLLFSPACRQTVGQGQNDECVREVQTLLKEAGGRLAVDGSFGPETLRRVTVFQVLAGLPPRGVVDDATKQALYDRKVSMETWTTDRVRRRIREVFAEEPDRAVAIADCQSYLDPQWVQPNTNGTRNWGVFQISEFRLHQFRATPSQALDPEWNIQAAYELWKERPDFSDWPNCARAAGIHPSPSAVALHR